MQDGNHPMHEYFFPYAPEKEKVKIVIVRLFESKTLWQSFNFFGMYFNARAGVRFVS
jgi:hypothetical protein